MNTESTQSTSLLSLGEQLAQARQAQNLSIDDVSSALNLRPTILKAIENNELVNKTIPAIFMKGYVRSYAHFLRLPENILEGHEKEFAGAPKNDLSKNARERKAVNPHSHSRWVGYLTALVIIAVAGMTALWWWENYQQSNNERDHLVQNYTTPENASASQANTASEVVPATVTNDSNREQTNTSTVETAPTPIAVQAIPDNSASLPTAVESQTTQPSDPIPAPQPVQNDNSAQAMLTQHSNDNAEKNENAVEQAVPAVDGDLQIQITNASSWISVKDVKRKVLAQKEYKQGEVLTFKDGAPYAVIIGAPSNVKITYKGENYPLKVDGRVAKFKLQ
ncbi:MAG: helix-turn-helix domain-containing protein [Pasteurellaceae bacterium]|nr:helix-turn-helix domain-containing protein [Pasteurellaceae bacterium]